MDAEWKSLPDTKQIAIAFTNGINAYIKHCGKRLPIEFKSSSSSRKQWAN